MIKEAPISFHPYLKSVIWGGNKICDFKGIPQTQEKIGESWEISEVPGYESVVSEGTYEGWNITELISRFQEELLGNYVIKKYNGKFPLLIKLIDAGDNLSVQVHPDDRLAMARHNSLGKTEMWYIINAEMNAKIYAGFNRKLSPDEYVERIANKTFAETLAVYDSRPGDVFFLPAGRVHSIGAGNLLAEIQESSDITYRIYDYDRTDASGNHRELHTLEAKDAIDFNIYDNYKNTTLSSDENKEELVSCDHFVTHRIKVKDSNSFTLNHDSFTVVMCVKGNCNIKCRGGETLLREGKTVLLPASVRSFSIEGDATLLFARSKN